ncbi:MAG TPA: riboflavin biosynthesis protein RibF [Firmicutes bacterium]|nr:riboflavin biosynthesis protein RibF [Bacillota bacterium]
MIVWNQLRPWDKDTALALGFFDGVHHAHRIVIEQAVTFWKEGLEPGVLSFSIQNARPDSKKGYLEITTPTVKNALFFTTGVAFAGCPAFETIQNMEPEQFFLDVLYKQMRAKVLVCGQDYRFGKNAAGTTDLLRSLGETYGVRVYVMPELVDDDEPVSSSRIRRYIQEGNMEEAHRMLGYPYTFDFPVTHGAKIGRMFGIPTINQVFPERYVMPRFGVYASLSIIGKKEYLSITNIGVKPTVSNVRTPLAETHIIGFSDNLYDQRVPVCLLEFLRPEQRFKNMGLLAEAVQQDIRKVEQKYRRHPVYLPLGFTEGLALRP